MYKFMYICIYITASSRALTTNALSLLSYQPPQPPQPMYIYIYIYNVARHFTNTAQMSGRCVLQAFVVNFYIFIVTVFLFFFF